jgi:membrane associated rhomboid family serine protease
MAKQDKDEDINVKDCKNNMFCRGKNSSGGASGAIYGLGLIGAAYYFIQHAHTFMDGIIGILKALVWPALLVYKLFAFFKF